MYRTHEFKPFKVIKVPKKVSNINFEYVFFQTVAKKKDVICHLSLVFKKLYRSFLRGALFI